MTANNSRLVSKTKGEFFMKRVINDIVGLIKGIGLTLYLSGLWVIPIILVVVYLIATSNLPDWMKFWLLR